MEPMKLLVVDDSVTNLLLFESMFENDPRISILLKDNGKDILDYCIQHAPNLILLDLMMPDVNGFEVLEILQGNTETKQIPIIIISALEGQVNIKRAIELGANDYIVKPIDFDDSTQMIYKILGL